MASIASGLLLGGLSALGGLFGGNKTTSDSTTSTTPNFNPQQLAAIQQILGQYSNLLNNTGKFNTAYETGGLRNFLNSSINANTNAINALNSRGINRTTAGAQTVADTGYQEGNQIANFLANAPIVEQQNTTDLLSKAGGFTTSIPTGSTSTSHTVSKGNAPISPVAGFLTGGSQGLAAALGQQTAAQNLANVLKNLPTNNSGGGGGFVAPSASYTLTPVSTFPTDNFSDTDSGGW